MTCQTCPAFDGGICRAVPPKPVYLPGTDTVFHVWAAVSPDDWCTLHPQRRGSMFALAPAESSIALAVEAPEPPS